MMRFLLALALLAPGVALAENMLADYQPAKSAPLAPSLREASGLTPAGATSLFTHNDEYAIIYEINQTDGTVIRAFALGRPTLRGDFEGVAILAERLYLVSSDGRVFETAPAAHRTRARFNVYDTGVGDHCEVEGLSLGRTDDELLLLCKLQKDALLQGRLQIFAWSLASRLAPARLLVDTPFLSVMSKSAASDFRPSDLARDPADGTLYVLSVSGAVLAIDDRGAARGYLPLDRERHPQPEGLALLSDHSLVIADEGGRKDGRLTIYRRD
jgi:uncharacterized protein YjiK